MMQDIDDFLSLVKQQIERKAKLYDGLNSVNTSGFDPIGAFMFSTIEELGEVSSAITRHRYELAKSECIDVAHSALLLYFAINKRKE